MAATWNTVNLRVGDVRKIGHLAVSDVQVYANITATELAEAYVRGSAVIGHNLVESVARYGTGNLLPVALEEALREAHGRLVLGELGQRVAGKIQLTPLIWARLFMYIVKAGNPGIKYRTLNPPTLVIGGYECIPQEDRHDYDDDDEDDD